MKVLKCNKCQKFENDWDPEKRPFSDVNFTTQNWNEKDKDFCSLKCFLDWLKYNYRSEDEE